MNDVMLVSLLAVAGEQQQGPGEPLLARNEELIDRVLFDPDVPGEHVHQEGMREVGRRREMRLGFPARHPSPKMVPGCTSVTTASLPPRDTIDSLTVPLSRKNTGQPLKARCSADRTGATSRNPSTIILPATKAIRARPR